MHPFGKRYDFGTGAETFVLPSVTSSFVTMFHGSIVSTVLLQSVSILECMEFVRVSENSEHV